MSELRWRGFTFRLIDRNPLTRLNDLLVFRTSREGKAATWVLQGSEMLPGWAREAGRFSSSRQAASAGHVITQVVRGVRQRV